MMTRSKRRHQAPIDEEIRPEVRHDVHRRVADEKPEQKPKTPIISKAFWFVMVCFFISAAAFYLDQWMSG